jgi:hypothetical protein
MDAKRVLPDKKRPTVSSKSPAGGEPSEMDDP